MSDNAIFSVSPIAGFGHEIDEYGNRNALLTDPARDLRYPQHELLNVRLRMKRDEFFGGEESRDHISEVCNNPSWGDVLQFASEGIRVTRDRHHIFLEAVEFSNEFSEDGCEYVDVWMGS